MSLKVDQDRCMTLHAIGLFLSAGSMAEYTDPTEAMIAMGARLNEAVWIMTLLIRNNIIGQL